MTTASQKDSYQRSVLEFRTSTLTVPVLVLADNDISAIESQLSIKIKQAPEFFKNAPIIIDLNKITHKKLAIDLVAILDLVGNAHLQPIGLRGASETVIQQAQELRITILPEERKAAAKPNRLPALEKILPTLEPAEQQKQSKSASDTKTTEIIAQPVRSGQKIYAKGDLVVLAAVSAGAEILAEGNIHVYGALRGRALAGVKGNENCRIFCSDLQAELISIAGNFQISDKINDAERGKPVHIRLENQKLIINEL